ncbi:Bifunctional transcriptional activator/DNA repair enzyme AdaA [Paenibacillus konkukensis]|uniref:Bifunctional transcriptional activator/DNA repair enzyme AdaA n=1 Tax=Paenibacillus konkukensis TaxID=2020716 RepID=A0ABY4RJ20_9BACL|nr:AraC family transcriptional regulator [Paenibacillus konkukensis]UQZ82426.1 Bifunctional transcriptional activator/DNA repair enzyme AdaA [Paenibacillus konkukensis]
MSNFQFNNAEGTFSISYRKALSHHMPASHFHSTYEIYYLLSGEREFFIKDRTMVMKEGDVIIISPNILHRTTNAETPAHERLIVNIHESDMRLANGSHTDILQPLFEQEYIVVQCSLQDRIAVEALAARIMQEIRDRKPGFEMYALTLVLQLLVICCRHVKQNSMEPPESPSPMHERISEVVRYINNHYMQELSLHLLAEQFYVSPYYLSRFFKEATGFTFVEYLNSVRIKEAKKLLEQSSMKVSLISKKVGFGSVTHFGRVFKSITGYAPLYYRKAK